MSEEELDYWFFNGPSISFGSGALSYLKDIEGDKCFIVTDDFIAKNLLHYVTDKLKKLGKKYEVFSGVQPDPKEHLVLEGLKQCNEYEPDLLVAVGGGSSIDTCKAIWLLYERPDLEIDDLHLFMELKTGKKAEMIAIPTTSGTGAETTWAMVITRVRKDGSEIKLELANRAAIPTYAILDPIFTLGLPPSITASTGMDALAHVSEAIISRVINDFSEGLAIKAIELLRKYLPVAYKDGKNLRAREAVHNAACIAGLAFGNSQVIVGHSLGHALGAIFHKPHGLCVGVVMLHVLQYMTNNPDKDKAELTKSQLANLSKKLGVAKWEDDYRSAIKKLYEEYRKIMSSIDFPSSIKELGIDREDFDSKVEDIARLTLESTSNVFGPRPVTIESLKKLLHYTYDGKDIDF